MRKLHLTRYTEKYETRELVSKCEVDTCERSILLGTYIEKYETRELVRKYEVDR